MKKVLALLLSVLMVMSCMVGMTFSAFAETEPTAATVEYQNLYNGDKIFNWCIPRDGSVTSFGQKFNVPAGKVLASLTMTFATANSPTLTISFYQWSVDYATTKEGTALYSTTFTPANDAEYTIEIPTSTNQLSDTLYWEVTNCTSTATVHGAASAISGVQTYMNGTPYSGTGWSGAYVPSSKIGYTDAPALATTVALASGGSGTTQYTWSKADVAQKFTVPSGKTLTGYHFADMATSGDGGVNTGTLKIYQWQGSYAVTTSLDPLATVDLINVHDGGRLDIDVDEELQIGGTVLAVMHYETGTGFYMPVVAVNGNIDGVVNYRGGVESPGEQGSSGQRGMDTWISISHDTEPATDTTVSSQLLYAGSPHVGGQYTSGTTTAKTFGQKFTVADGKVLAGVSFDQIHTYGDGNTNSGTFKVWRWKEDYATTTAAKPLYQKTISNLVNDQNGGIVVDTSAKLSGELYYEVAYTSGTGTQGYVPRTAGGNATGVVSYRDGVEYIGNGWGGGTGIAATLTLKNIPGFTTERVDLYQGAAGNGQYIWQQHKGSFGQMFTVPGGKTLTSVVIGQMFNMGGTNTNTGTFKLWQWQGDYATTTDTDPVFTYNLVNVVEGASLTIYIPSTLGIEGTLYYEIVATSHANTAGYYSPLIATGGAAPGVVSYNNGVTFKGEAGGNNGKDIYAWITVTNGGYAPAESDYPLFNGTEVGSTQYNWDINYKKIGQKIVLPDGKLFTGITFHAMNTMVSGNNKGTFKVWLWNSDYATTTAAAPLYTVNLVNVNNGGAYAIDVPATAGAVGTIFWELHYEEGEGTYAPDNAKDNVITGVTCYRDGEEWNGYATNETEGGIWATASLASVNYIYVNSVDKQVIYTGNTAYADLADDYKAKFDAAADMYAVGDWRSFDGTFTLVSSDGGIIVYYTNHDYSATVTVDTAIDNVIVDTEVKSVNDKFVMLEVPETKNGQYFGGWLDEYTGCMISYEPSFKFYLRSETARLQACYFDSVIPFESCVQFELERASDELLVTVIPVRVVDQAIIEYGYFITAGDDLNEANPLYNYFSSGAVVEGNVTDIAGATRVSTNGSSAYLQRTYSILNSTKEQNITVVAYITYTDAQGTHTVYTLASVASPYFA